MAFGYGPAKCPHAGTAYRNRIRSKQMMVHADTRLAELAERLMSLDQERAAIVAEIEDLRSAHAFEMSPHTGASTEQDVGRIHMHSTGEKKIALFQRLFRGRADV